VEIRNIYFVYLRDKVGSGLDRFAPPNLDHPANATEWNCYWMLAPFCSHRFRSSISGTVKIVPYSFLVNGKVNGKK